MRTRSNYNKIRKEYIKRIIIARDEWATDALQNKYGDIILEIQ